LQESIDLFSKGRRSENQSLGIGACAYYRRIVEARWHELVDAVLRVAKATEAEPAKIAALENARDSKEFSGAVDSIKEAVPKVLFIHGENPLTLLHRLLSHRLHEMTDAECLEDAHAIRLVLVRMVERMADALSDEAELKSAVDRLRSGTKPRV